MTKRELPLYLIDGEERQPNPRDVRPDGSIMLSCVGGPLDRKVLRVYPPHDDGIAVAGGFYLLGGPVRKRGKDNLHYHKENQ